MSKLIDYLKNLRIGPRILAAFGLVILLLAAVLLRGHAAIGQLSEESTTALRVNAPMVERASQVKLELGELRRSEKDLFLNIGNAARSADYEAKWNATRKNMTQTLNDLEHVADTVAEKRDVGLLREHLANYEKGFQDVLSRIKAHELTDPSAANNAMEPNKNAIHAFDALADRIVDEQEKIVAALPDVIERQASRARQINLAIGALALFLAIAISQVLSRGITKPLGDTVKQAQDIMQGRVEITAKEELGQMQQAFAGVRVALEETRALKEQIEKDNKELQQNIIELLGVVADASDGDLTVRAKISAGSLGNVADAFNSLMESLQELLGRVRTQIDKNITAVSEIRDASVKMSSGATKQAEDVEGATKLVETMSKEIARVAGSANQAAEAAKRTEMSAQEGSRAVQDVISGMGTLRANVQAGAKKMKNLGDRSMEITGIVGTISRISEQTNMLALNAAIEAARAGEHGRGFSVVAEEVRKLAERTATATQEIDRLVKAIHVETNETVDAIEQQTHVVEQESQVVGKAGEQLQKIRQVSTESTSIVVDISSIAKKQAEGTQSVVKVMEQISAIAKATRLNVDGTAATVQQLAQLSDELKSSVARFKVA